MNSYALCTVLREIWFKPKESKIGDPLQRSFQICSLSLGLDCFVPCKPYQIVCKLGACLHGGEEGGGGGGDQVGEVTLLCGVIRLSI